MPFLCCFSAVTAEEKPVVLAPVNKDVSKADYQGSAAADAPSAAAPVPEQQKQDVDKPWNKLNESESEAVKQTLMKVRVLRYWGFRVRGVIVDLQYCAGGLQMQSRGSWVVSVSRHHICLC
jgi:hypothetical protein